MNTALRSFSLLAIVATAIPALAATTPEPLTSGKFLVLRNGHTLEGDIERIGEQYRVRRNGGETLVPANTVLRLFRDADECCAFLRGKLNPLDPDDRLRLAKWCFDLGMRKQALEEALEADRLCPKHAPTQQLLTLL